MKTKILSALLILSLAWAGTVSFLYWKLKSNPRVIAVTMEAGKESLQNMQLGDLEKMTFLRQYLERFFNYDSNNFWQSQTSLAFLMAPNLAEQRVREINRLREKIQQKNFSQGGTLKSIRQQSDGSYEAVVYLQINEDSQKRNLYVTTRLRLQEAERTLENPWGLLVREMNFASSPQAAPFSAKFSIQAQSPTVLTFPCAIENIENSDEKNLKIKITTLNVSELQLTPGKTLPECLALTATCKDLEFKLELVQNKDLRDLYVAVPFEAGTLRKKETVKTRKKDIYDKTIENVLGIRLDE